MEKTGLYPGSFDCFTHGHQDIVSRALRIFDKLYIGIAINTRKDALFSPQERKALLEEIYQDNPAVEIICFKDLTVQQARKLAVNAIVRGLRAVSDFEYEYQMTLANRSLDQEIETIFLMSDKSNMFISSSMVKEIAMLGGDVSKFLPELVNRALIRKIRAQKGEDS